MFQYQLQPADALEGDLWRENSRLATGEFFGLQMGHSFERTTPGMVLEEARVTAAEVQAGTFAPTQQYLDDGMDPEPVEHPHALSEEEWRGSEWFRKGIDYRPDMTPQRARILSEVYDRRRHEEELLDRNSDTWGRKAIGFGAALLANLPDPVNFIPFVGPGAKGASIAVRAARGAADAAIGTTMADALILPAAKARGDDVGWSDFALDLMFGAAIGGGVGGVAGKVSGMRRERMLRDLEPHRQELASLLGESGFDGEAAERLARQTVETLADTPGGSDMGQLLRRTLHGEDRAGMARVFEDALSRVSRGDAADIRPAVEALQLRNAYDRVLDEVRTRTAPQQAADEVLAALRPEDIEPLLVTRGPSVDVNGEIRVQGRELQAETGSRAGYGLVKIIVKHGEEGVDPMPVTRDNVLALPRFVREYMPVDGAAEGRRTWVIPREDGGQLVIGEGRMEDGSGMLVTMHVRPEGRERAAVSQRRTPAESAPGRFPAVPEGTGGELPHRSGRSPQGHTPGAPGEENIAHRQAEGKTSVDWSSPREAVRDVEGTGDARAFDRFRDAEVERLRAEGRADPEAVAELERAALDAARVDELENVALQLLGCILEAV